MTKSPGTPAAAIAAAVALTGGELQADMLIVLNKSDHQVVLVDPVRLEVIAKLPTGQGPHEAAVSPDNRRAYVANYGAYALFRDGEAPKMTPGSTLTVVDLVKRTVIDTIDLGEFRSPHGMVASADGKKLWVTCEGSGAVIEIETANGRVARHWLTGQDISHMIVATPDEKKLYVANIRSGTVSVIDRATDSVLTVPTGAGAEGIDVAPSGKEVWVTNRSANTISVIDVRTDDVVDTLEGGGEFPIRAKFTPDGREVWVSVAKSNRIVVFDAATRKPLATILVGAMPIGIQMSADGKRAFIANTNDDLITVIDVPARKVLGTFTTGKEPDGMAWAKAPGKKK